VPWLFPFAWIIGNYVEKGNPFHFVVGITEYKRTWYGQNRSFGQYLSTFLRIDPFATVLAFPALALCLIRYVKSRPVQWYVAMSVVPFFAFLYLHGGQLEPPGNYVRYLAPYLFMVYPAIMLLLYTAMRFIRARVARSVVVILVVALMVITQARTVFAFKNDPTAQGLAVGLKIQAMRAADPTLAHRPVLVEVSYWQYLAIHTGANDLSSLIYDRPLDSNQRQAPSLLLLSDPNTIRNCLSRHDISHLVVKTHELRELIEQDLGIPPSEEVNGYFFYPVPEDLAAQGSPGNLPCPFVPRSGRW
jgi:hypothetical protein